MRLIEDYNGVHGSFFEKEAQKRIQMFNEHEVSVDEGIVRWKSNNRIPPKDLLELWHYTGCSFDYYKSLKAQEQENMAFLQEYRQQMKDYIPTKEELTEMRATFGSTVVVDVLTGKKIKL